MRFLGNFKVSYSFSNSRFGLKRSSRTSFWSDQKNKSCVFGWNELPYRGRHMRIPGDTLGIPGSGLDFTTGDPNFESLLDRFESFEYSEMNIMILKWMKYEMNTPEMNIRIFIGLTAFLQEHFRAQKKSVEDLNLRCILQEKGCKNGIAVV